MEDKVFKFRDTTATRKIFQLKKRIRAVSGGTGASKTVSILVWCIDYVQSTRDKLVSVISENYPHLSGGAIRDFENVMKDRRYWRETRWVRNPRTVYTFETGSQIEFVSIDNYGKAHGPRRDVLFINEANNLDYTIVDQLITRTREVVWLDWNPSSEFWFYTEMLGKRNDIEFMGVGGDYPPLTFQDNEGLDEGAIQEIYAHKDNPRWWKVYGEGKLGEIEGRIYTGWQRIESIPYEARLERLGLNFGYFPHPLGLVAVYYYNGGYVLDEVLYGHYIENPTIASTIKAYFTERSLPPVLTIADSAEPKSIAEIRRFSINIIGTEKGKDSKRYGVKTVQAQRISYTASSINLEREYRNYYQLMDKKTNLPIMGEYDGDYFILDGVRYALCSLIPIIQRKELLQQFPVLPSPQRINPAL